MRARLRPFSLAVAALAAGACSSSAPSAPDAHLGDDVSVPEVDSAAPDVATEVVDGGRCGDALRILRVSPWPGGGVSVAFSLTAPDGGPGDLSALAPTLDGAPVPLAPAHQAAGITGIVLTAGDRDTLDRARAFVRGLPDGELVVLWSGGTLLAEATTDEPHVLARLTAAPAVAGAPPWPELLDALAGLGGADGPLDRTLVVAGPPGGEPADPRVRVVPLGDGLAAELAARRVGFGRVGACAAPRDGRPMTLEVAGVRCTFPAPAPLGYLAREPCDAAAAARDAWPYGERVDVVFTPEEAAVYASRVAARSKADFRASVRLGAGDPLPATLHLRGQSSLACARKSYKVNLDGGAPRRLAPGAANDELLLISMCMDDGYYRQLFAERIASALGLFPLRSRLVTLGVDGDNRGVYLLLEDPTEALREDAVAPDAIIRRRLDQDGNRAEVHYAASGDADAALRSYDAMVAAGGDPDALARRLDVEGYLGWMAWATLLRNGDYVDEVYFHGADEAGAGDPWYRVLGWDPDDLWSACHRGGAAAIPDAHGILYCAEADLDHLLFANPALYERFVARLEGLLAAYPIERMTELMAAVRAQLVAAVRDDATAAAMTELAAEHPEARTVAGFREVVSDLMNADLDRAAAWLGELRAHIDAYRSGR